jgi:hypothetical protein
MVNYVKAEFIEMRLNPELNEKWIQAQIAADPTILGLGDLVLRDKERRQPRAGRLDLLLQDIQEERRYEVELQLGATDETHIIRTIEYWDIERKRYPQYKHCAVLIAEDITSRFLNVVSLFNGTIPFIAIQMRAVKFREHVTLVFTTVMDELTRGPVDEDEDANATPTDRGYWERRGTPTTVKMAEDVLEIAKEFDPSLELKYNKFYIGTAKDGQGFNIVVARPKKKHVNVEIKLPRSDDVDQRLDDAGIETLEYAKRWGAYRLSLDGDDIAHARSLLRDLIKLAYENRTA